MDVSRRNLMALSAAALAAGAAPGLASAQAISFTPSPIYPDPSIQVLDPSFAKYRVASSSLEQVATGARWLEGPVWFGDGRYLLVSDIPNNRVMKYDESNETWSVFNANSNYANGHARDRQGRLLSCEHLTRRVTRTEYDGSITILADNYMGKKLNSPNDIICKSDGSIWFTDPPFGIAGEWEGEKAQSELPHSVYCILPDGKLNLVTDELKGPNGIAFSEDEKKLYVVEGRATPYRILWSYDVAADGVKLSNKRALVTADDNGGLDGFKVDVDGNLWCGWGSNGAAGARPEDLNGVKIFNKEGKAIGFIKLPERCPNLVFGGPKRNRLYMASSHSVYALYVETRGAV
ncbi:SMP-30/gluconolactonase/LRE family protein [Rhizobium deserti]|uniref:SMP-30/gluconolactonase/LRE family protein n=1 Tax=Rhizobium deserti TaxID=2547961 RepID=A0A4R5UJX9_9HYPH|nr:SMP-30/gluconolactonase/LRE family protein [Rhizobium deserti]TDK37170.1 SMP-30/gluconolactonase/LRE family protein [Rhizobium deserti]